MLPDYIECIDVPLGTSVRDNCPACKGYKTLSVSNLDGHVMWNCYKASCKLRGADKTSLTAEDIKRRLKGYDKRKLVFDMPKHLVSCKRSRVAMDWISAWGLEEQERLLRYDILEHRVVFPVRHDAVVVDATGRSLGKRMPKWKRYGKSSLPFAYGSGTVAVVVEDCVSAAIVGTSQRTGVALMGTSMSDEHTQYLSRFSTAIIALDPDALPKAVEMCRDLRPYVDTVKVLKLHDDLKYRNEEDFNNLENIQWS